MRRCAVILALLLADPVSFASAQEQVNVSVKIVEFQTTKGVDTGLSAYFRQRNAPAPYGRVVSGNGNITSADFTFPNSTSSGVTVFLDRISNAYGDFEIVLQGLVDQNRARILSQPKVMVPIGQTVPTIIQTTQEIPYESTVVVGATVAQITQFRPTGVTLNVTAPQIIDDDGRPETSEDTYIQLTLTAEVNEEGQRITVALDDLVASSGVFAQTSNAISVPEFISRSITTTVWVRHGQVLILGGLYRTSTNRTVTTVPWLPQGEDIINSAVQRILPFTVPDVPISAGIGQNSRQDARRELVFLVRAERWKPAFTVSEQFTDYDDDDKKSKSPTDVIRGVIQGIADLPPGISDSFRSGGSGVSSKLGGDDE